MADEVVVDGDDDDDDDDAETEIADIEPNAAVVHAEVDVVDVDDADDDDEDDDDEDGTPVATVVDVAAADVPGGDGIGAGAYCMQPELVDEDGDAGGEPWLEDGR